MRGVIDRSRRKRIPATDPAAGQQHRAVGEQGGRVPRLASWERIIYRCQGARGGIVEFSTSVRKGSAGDQDPSFGKERGCDVALDKAGCSSEPPARGIVHFGPV